MSGEGKVVVEVASPRDGGRGQSAIVVFRRPRQTEESPFLAPQRSPSLCFDRSPEIGAVGLSGASPSLFYYLAQ